MSKKPTTDTPKGSKAKRGPTQSVTRGYPADPSRLPAMREIVLPPGAPPPPGLYAPATPAPPSQPVNYNLDPAVLERQMRNLRDIEDAGGEPPPIVGYDPFRTPEYLEQQRQQRIAELHYLLGQDGQQQAATPSTYPVVVPTPPSPYAPYFAPIAAEEETDDDDDDDGGEEEEEDDESEDGEGEDGEDTDDDWDTFVDSSAPPSNPYTADGQQQQARPNAAMQFLGGAMPPLAPVVAGKWSGWLDLADADSKDGSRPWEKYRGWKIRINLEQSVQFLEAAETLQQAVTDAQRASLARGRTVAPRIKVNTIMTLLRDVVGVWNYVDDFGYARPQPPEGLSTLRGDLLIATFDRAMTEMMPAKKKSRRSRPR